MDRAVRVVLLSLLFFAATVRSEVQLEPIYPNKAINATVFNSRTNFELKCSLTGDAEDDITVKWERNKTDIKAIPALEGRYTISSKANEYVLRVDKATEPDAGNYSCVGYSKNVEVARAYPFASCAVKVKTPENVNVVEGEKLRITCTVIGNPLPTIKWNITAEQSNSTARERAIFQKDEEKGVENAILIIEDIQMSDRGTYTCIGSSEFSKTSDSSETTVRIKDKYAALWPFLGICAEVFVLCAIILIYEKKRNKTELEESDTDQSPDQKNTPDHGKESNLRHRQ